MSKTVILYKRDFSDYAINDLKLWDALTGDDKTVDEVEVTVVAKSHGEAVP